MMKKISIPSGFFFFFYTWSHSRHTERTIRSQPAAFCERSPAAQSPSEDKRLWQEAVLKFKKKRCWSVQCPLYAFFILRCSWSVCHFLKRTKKKRHFLNALELFQPQIYIPTLFLDVNSNYCCLPTRTPCFKAWHLEQCGFLPVELWEVWCGGGWCFSPVTNEHLKSRFNL